MRRFFASVVKLIYRGIRPLGMVDVTYLLHMNASDAQLRPSDCRFRLKVLDPEELGLLRDDNRAPERIGRFTDADRQTLVVALDGDRIVSFLWIVCRYVEAKDNYSRNVRLGTSVELPVSTGFLYNAWTDPAYRGQRLVGMLSAFAVGEGIPSVRAMLTSVDWTNQPSIRAFGKVGMQPIGLVARFALGPIQLTLTPRNANELGIQIAGEIPGPKIAF